MNHADSLHLQSFPSWYHPGIGREALAKMQVRQDMLLAARRARTKCGVYTHDELLAELNNLVSAIATGPTQLSAFRDALVEIACDVENEISPLQPELSGVAFKSMEA